MEVLRFGSSFCALLGHHWHTERKGGHSEPVLVVSAVVSIVDVKIKIMSKPETKKVEETEPEEAPGAVVDPPPPETADSYPSPEDPEVTEVSVPHQMTDDSSLESGEEEPTAGDHQGDQEEAVEQPKKPKAKKLQINPDFKDVQDTGKWGSVSRKEIAIVVGVVAIILIAAAVVVALLLTKGGDDPVPNQESAAPTAAPTTYNSVFRSVDEKYNALLGLVGEHAVTQGLLETLPATAADLYKSFGATAGMPPVIQAASWVIYHDESNKIEEFGDRFALASIYFSTKGDNWIADEYWLSDRSVCDWAGVRCSIIPGVYKVEEIDLSSNNLNGEAPVTLALLRHLSVVWLNDNELRGAIPGEVFGSLPVLQFLYLQDNQFTGEIPVSLLDSGSLGKYLLRMNFVRSFGGHKSDTAVSRSQRRSTSTVTS